MKQVFSLVSILILTTSCSSALHRGVIAMKIDNSTAHVGLNSTEVKTGDHVELYENKCTRNAIRKDSTATQLCTKNHKGHGTVTKVLSEDYAEVKFDDGVSFEEGNFVEKHSH